MGILGNCQRFSEKLTRELWRGCLIDWKIYAGSKEQELVQNGALAVETAFKTISQKVLDGNKWGIRKKF